MFGSTLSNSFSTKVSLRSHSVKLLFLFILITSAERAFCAVSASNFKFITYNIHIGEDERYIEKNPPVGLLANAVYIFQEVPASAALQLTDTAVKFGMNGYIGTSQYGGTKGEFLPIYWKNNFSHLDSNSWLGADTGSENAGTRRVFNISVLNFRNVSGAHAVVAVVNYHLDNWSAYARDLEWKRIGEATALVLRNWQFDIMVLCGDDNSYPNSQKELILGNYCPGAEFYTRTGGNRGIDGCTIMIPNNKILHSSNGARLPIFSMIKNFNLTSLPQSNSDHLPVLIDFQYYGIHSGTGRAPYIQPNADGGIVTYQDINCSKPNFIAGFQGMNIGNQFGAGDPPRFGFPNDSISSFRVSGRVNTVQAWDNSNQTGTNHTYFGTQNWVGDDINDRISCISWWHR